MTNESSFQMMIKSVVFHTITVVAVLFVVSITSTGISGGMYLYSMPYKGCDENCWTNKCEVKTCGDYGNCGVVKTTQCRCQEYSPNGESFFL